MGREKGLYRQLKDARRILNLGKIQSTEDGIYNFTSVEVVQLIVAFYAGAPRPESE